MAIWPRPHDGRPPLDLAAITREVEAFAGEPLRAWEAGYLDLHRRRYQDTLRLLPDGHGRRLLDVGSFPGHLSALARAAGWDVTGLNTQIESADDWATFLERCRRRGIRIAACEVEREPFPVATASIDAVLLCELFEHLYWNPFHTLKEIFRVLEPGGLLILTTPNLRRVETLIGYLHDWGPHTPLSSPFRVLFPSLLYHRHNREYTATELDYYLGRQGKDLYDFRLDPVYYSDCLDGDPAIPGVKGQRVSWPERRAARLVRRVFARTRGQLIARAWRSDAALVEWSALAGAEGFGPLREDDHPEQGFTRRLTFPFRPAGARAAFEVPLPSGIGPALISLMVAYVDHTSPASTRWSLDGHPAMTLPLRPSPRPLRVRLYVPAALTARGAVRVTVETTPDRPGAAEPGFWVGGQWVLVERLATPAAVDAAISRVEADRRAEDSLDPAWWHAAQSLYVARRVTRPALEVGPDDDAQLGPGWYQREHWGRLGWVRWGGTEAVAYLRSAGGVDTVRARLYTGDAKLGAVSGRLCAEHASPDGGFVAAGEVAFAFPADRWEELAVPIPPAPGHVRVTLRADAPRVPRDRIPGSQDVRALSLVLKRLWLA